jgi:hypothetical protein
MAVVQIGIYIYPAGTTGGDIQVVPDPADASSGDFLLFEVRVLRDDITEVEIEFDTLDLLHQGTGLGFGLQRKKEPNQPGSRKFDFRGRARMLATGPDVQSDKYTVRTFCGEDEGPHLDPRVIICR